MPAAGPSGPPVTLAIVNARIVTGDPRRPWADALAVRGDRLAALASSAEVRKLGAARIVDARRGLVVSLIGASIDPADDGLVASVIATVAPAFAGRSDDASAPPLDPDRRLARDAPADFVLLDAVEHDGLAGGARAEPRPRLIVVGGRVVHDADVIP